MVADPSVFSTIRYKPINAANNDVLRLTTEIDWWWSREREVLMHNDTTFVIETNDLCIIIDSKWSLNHLVCSIAYQILVKLKLFNVLVNIFYDNYALKLLYFILVHLNTQIWCSEIALSISVYAFQKFNIIFHDFYVNLSFWLSFFTWFFLWNYDFR